MFRLLFLSLILVFIYPTASFSQISFERTYGNDNSNWGYSVQQTMDGGYIIAGESGHLVFPFPHGPYYVCDAYLIKTDSSGDTLWTKTYLKGRMDRGYSVQQTADGGYIIGGVTQGGYDPNIFGRVYLIKTDSVGDSLWTRTYGDGENEEGYSVQQTTDGGYIIAGYTDSFSAGSRDVYLIKIDSAGDTLWTRTYGGDVRNEGHSIKETEDGGYVIAGQSGYADGSIDVYLIKTDSSGDTLWTREYGGDENDEGNSVQQTADGGYVITGYTESFGAGRKDVYLIKTDSSGDTLWTRTYGGNSYEEGHSVQQTADRGYVITGYTDSFGAGAYDVYLIKTDSSGDTQWTRTYGGNSYEEGHSVRQTADRGYVITGYTESFGAGSSNVYLIKTDPDGMVGISDNKPPSMDLPRSWALSQNYPNPFNPSTTISFEIPGNSATKQHVSLTVYDIRGRRVKTLVDSDLEPGIHKIHWDGRDDRGQSVASGIYLYTLRTGSETFTRKMMVLK
jgi:hypothetical protein